MIRVSRLRIERIFLVRINESVVDMPQSTAQSEQCLEFSKTAPTARLSEPVRGYRSDYAFMGLRFSLSEGFRVRGLLAVETFLVDSQHRDAISLILAEDLIKS